MEPIMNLLLTRELNLFLIVRKNTDVINKRSE